MAQKNNKLQYILVGLVVLIWGALVYQFFNYQGDQDFIASKSDAFLPIAKSSVNPTASFVLQADYPDPFLGAKRPQKVQKSNLTKKRFVPPSLPSIHTPPAKQASMPPVIYQGYSLNNNKISRVRLVIENKAHHLQLGEDIAGVKVEQITRDSVVLKWKGGLKTVFRKK